MGNKIKISDIDCIFISYDEPNAEKHWADLLDKCFWAQRVHGVKGSDECHKAAANLSATDWFVTVDADNIVNPAFFNLEVDVPNNTQAMSWPGLNIVNGLRYGNGSLKMWHKDFVLNMRTHEAAEQANGQVDFCWEDGYRPMTDSYSTTYINATPYQAWRAGFREGVKMSLVDGMKPQDPSVGKLFWHNLHRLKIWMSVGGHVNQGGWAMLGARHGCWKTNCTNWDHVEVRDFDCLAEIWKEVANADPMDAIVHYGQLLEKDFGLRAPWLGPETSEFVAGTLDAQYIQVLEQLKWTMKRNNV
jgi:hypothetical protein